MLSGTVTLTTTGATSPPASTVNLTVLAPSQATAPFGVIDTPTEGQTGVTGSLPVTGWAVDDVDIARLRVMREPVGSESGLVFIGDAIFVTGARPDVAALYPTTPLHEAAGWGVIVLTNYLPNQGNGTFRLHVFADDVDGHSTLLGTRTITCTNATATAPFGAIDTPAPGATASGGTYVNFGWALAAQPTGSGRFIPFDGSTIVVYVDSLPVGTVTYNNPRPDIQTLFPGYANTDGAIGFRLLDTTALSNGVHTLAWVVTDNLGAAAGIGSRFFTVSNSSSGLTAEVTAAVAPAAAGVMRADTMAAMALGSSPAGPVRRPVIDANSPVIGDATAGTTVRLNDAAILLTRGYAADTPPDLVLADVDGVHPVRVAPLERIVLDLNAGGDRDAATYRGYTIDGTARRALPAGSSLNPATGAFAWAPGLAFGGTWDLVFVRRCAHGTDQIRVRIDIRAR